MVRPHIKFKQVKQARVYPIGYLFTFSDPKCFYVVTDYVISHDSDGEVISLVYVCITNKEGTPMSHKFSQQRLNQAKARF